MKLVQLRCKNCGAVLEVNSELNKVFCNYCGSEMIIDDEANSIERIETARLRSRKSNHEQSMKEKMDNYEFNKRINEDVRKQKIITTIIMGIIGVAFMIIGFMALDSNPGSSWGYFAIIGMFIFMSIYFVWLDNSKK